MPAKPAAKDLDDVVDILYSLSKHIDGRFDEVFKRLDRIEFLVSGQERRISILEDRMRVVATKLDLEFRQ